jgi:hypothetical protein
MWLYYPTTLLNRCEEGEGEDRREQNQRFISSMGDMLVIATTCFGHQVVIFKLYSYEEKMFIYKYAVVLSN